MTINVRLLGAPDREALEILIRNFDVSDVGEKDSPEALRYNLERIAVAERDIQKIEDPKERRGYSDWLHFFRAKTEAALCKFPPSRPSL